MDQVETSGRTVEDALSAALRQLNCTKDDVEFTVLDEGRRGFLGRGSRDAVVRVVRINTTTATAGAAPRGGGRGSRNNRGSRPAGDGPAAPSGDAPRDRGGRGGRDRGPRGGGGGQRGRRQLESSTPELTEADFVRGRGASDDTAETPLPQEQPASGRSRGGGSRRPSGSRDDRGSGGREGRDRSRSDQPRRQREHDEPEVDPNIDAEEVDIAATIVDDILRVLDIDAEINLREPLTPGDGKGSSLAVIDIAGEDLGVLIGRRGDTLGSLQYLVNLALLRRYPGTPGVTLDIEHYRHRREEQLSTLAQRMADRVRENGSPITLEPMPPAERRLVHLALAEDPDVETASIGDGDSRKVVISPRRR